MRKYSFSLSRAAPFGIRSLAARTASGSARRPSERLPLNFTLVSTVSVSGFGVGFRVSYLWQLAATKLRINIIITASYSYYDPMF